MPFRLQIQQSHNIYNNAKYGHDKELYTQLYEFLFPKVPTVGVSKNITQVIF